MLLIWLGMGCSYCCSWWLVVVIVVDVKLWVSFYGLALVGGTLRAQDGFLRCIVIKAS